MKRFPGVWVFGKDLFQFMEKAGNNLFIEFLQILLNRRLIRNLRGQGAFGIPCWK